MYVLALIIILGVALVAGGLWFAANPGTVSADWLGWQIETNMMFGLIGLLILFALFWVLVKLVLAIGTMLGLRGVKTRGNLVSAAKGMGEAYAALRVGQGGQARADAHRARRAYRNPAKCPATLMEADGYAMAGDAETARGLYNQLLDNPDTEGAAIRGMLDLAVAEGNDEAIREYTERAFFKVDNPVWAARPALELALRTGRLDDVEKPLQVLEQSGQANPDEMRRMRAEAFLKRVEAAEAAGKTGDAVTLCRQALDLTPDSAMVVNKLARLLAADGKVRKAEQVIQDAWRRAPAAVLASTWRDLGGVKDANALASRMQTLAALNPQHAESRLAVAEGAVEAKQWAQARTQLRPLITEHPDLRTCLLMARIEEGESGDSTKALDWMRRAVAAADGLGGVQAPGALTTEQSQAAA
ncbi:heme biosynthesis HemY N-terminal domain-containing protein [uncultured Rhodospira sp.]|uniref:heme biosynthesis HemY N-terminal domain-containing protein n=1 Tax=uncultured Rhodospira sp. TaxID=1936189 RepID=UPI002609D880|nr:heme biosynthesis HemY N-terminal domain-containing protein [uncultured Rhodospira sp.]